MQGKKWIIDVFALSVLLIVASSAKAQDTTKNDVNWEDPNLQTDQAKATQCQFQQHTGGGVFSACKEVETSSREQVQKQVEEKKRQIEQQRAQYQGKKKPSSHDGCIDGCDKWYSPSALPKMNASCKADCPK